MVRIKTKLNTNRTDTMSFLYWHLVVKSSVKKWTICGTQPTVVNSIRRLSCAPHLDRGPEEIILKHFMYIRVQCTWICKKCESYYVIARRFQNNRRGANTPLSEYSLSSLVLKSLDKLTNSLFKNSNSCKTEVAQVARSCLSVHNVPASFYLKQCCWNSLKVYLLEILQMYYHLHWHR